VPFRRRVDQRGRDRRRRKGPTAPNLTIDDFILKKTAAPDDQAPADGGLLISLMSFST
jgi:hypothetical protein